MYSPRLQLVCLEFSGGIHSSQLFTYFVSVIFKSLLSVLHVALKGVGFNPIKRNFNLLIYTNSEKVPVLKAAITDLR